MKVQWTESMESPDRVKATERTMEKNQIRTVPFKILVLQRLSIVTHFRVIKIIVLTFIKAAFYF